MIKRLLAVAMFCAVTQGQVPVTPIVQPRVTFVDASGGPCAGCTLSSFAAGTTTPLATYRDATGTSQNTNPIILDASGGAFINLSSSSYKLILKDPSGATIWSVDQVSAGHLLPCSSANAVQSANTSVNGLTCDPTITINTINHTINVGTLPTNHVSIGALGTPTAWTLDTTTAATALASLGGSSGAPLANLTNNFLSTNVVSQTVRAWGTSQTQGFGIDFCGTLTCHPPDSYPQQFGNAMGWTVDNQGYGSSQCADLSYSGTSESMWDGGPMSITTSSRNIYAHIRNDQKNGIDPFQLDYARGCIEAEMAWLAIPEIGTAIPGPGKIRAAGSGCTKTGTWVDGGVNAAESVAMSAGATLQCTLTGKTVYVAAARVFGSTAVYSILVDGVGVYDPITRGTTFDQTMTIAPVTGFPVSSNVTPDLIRAPGQLDATHSVTFTCITPGSLGCMVFYMAAVSTDNSTANGPFVYAVGDFYNAAAQQTGQFTPQFTDLYQAQWRRAVSELQSDGLQIVALDTTNPQVYNPLNSLMVQSDGVHPTAAGATTIAAALVSKATSAATPSDRAEGRMPNFNAAYDCAGAGQSINPAGVGLTNLLYPGIPAGCIWSSTGGQTGRFYGGYEGTSFLERIIDDPTNVNGAGSGHLWRFGDAQGATVNTNLALPGQYTSIINGVDNGGTTVNINGSTTSQDVAEGSNGQGITNWPNNAILNTNHNRVINADAGTIYFQSAHDTKAFVDSTGLHVNGTLSSTVLSGSGKALACLDASGNLYRGTATTCP